MNLCFLTTSYPRFTGDDAGIFVARLVNALSKTSEKVLVLVPKDSAELSHENRENIEVKRTRYKISKSTGIVFGAGMIPNLSNRPWLVLQLPGLGLSMLLSSIKYSRGYDVLLANWIFSGFIARLSQLVTAKPYIYIVRGAEIKILNSLVGKLIFKIVISNSRKTICVSEEFTKMLRETFPSFKDKILHIANGISVDTPSAQEMSKFLETKQLNTKYRTLLFVGTIIPRKNITWLIELLAKPELKEFQLILCGRLHDTNYVSELHELIAKHGIGERFHLVGEIVPSEVSYYMTFADAYITASTHEGTPNSLLEALSLGRTVFASNITAHQDLIIDGKNGYLFNLESSTLDTKSDLAKRISLLFNDLNSLSILKKNARDSVRERSWENCAKKYIAILDS